MKRTAVVTGGLTGAVLLVMLLVGATLAGAKKPVAVTPNVEPGITYTLQTASIDGQTVFLGVGGEIDGVVNPTLGADAGEVVQVKLLSADGEKHTLAFPNFGAKSHQTSSDGVSSVVLRADQAGTFTYFCAGAGHRAAGMVGQLVIG